MNGVDLRTILYLVAAAVVGMVLLWSLRARGSGLYRRSAGMGYVLLVFAPVLAFTGSISWRFAILSMPLGLIVWWRDPFRQSSSASVQS